MQNIIITTGHERHKALVNDLIKNNLPYALCKSVIPNKNDIYYGCSVGHRGNSGLSVGHLRALKIASKSTQQCNIFEDDEIIRTSYNKKRMRLLSELANWDYVNFNTLRPVGSDYSNNFVKIDNKSPRYARNGYVNNIWLSNYCVSPKFAKEIVSLLINNYVNWHGTKHKLCSCFGSHVFDQYFALHVASISNKYNCYSIKNQNLISIHDEKISIRKNNK